MRRLILAVALAGCSKEPEPVPREPPPAPAPAPAPVPDPDRERAMIDRVIAALAANDYSQIESALSTTARETMGTETKKAFQKIHRLLADTGVDLAKAEIVKVKHSGERVVTIDVELIAESGKPITLHLVVLASPYELVTIGDHID